MIGKHTEKRRVDFSDREAEILAKNYLRVEANAQNTLNLWIQRAILRKKVGEVGMGIGLTISILSIALNVDDILPRLGGLTGGILVLGLSKLYADKQEQIIKKREEEKISKE